MTRAVFVHGVPDTHRLWNPMLEQLDVDAVCLSLPGFDAPVPVGFDATKEGYVDWVIEQVAAIGEPVDLVGHDWGSLLVQRVASLRFGQRLAARVGGDLVVLPTRHWWPVQAPVEAAAALAEFWAKQ